MAMAKVVKFPVSPPAKLGPEKVRQRRRKDLEEHGQLNLFNQITPGRVKLLDPNSSYFEQALQLDEAGDQQLAETFYLKAIDANQSIADAHCNLGIMHSKALAYPKAIDHLTMALKSNARHFEAHYNLGNVYSEVGNYNLAAMHYQVAIEIEPHFPNSHYNLALVLISQKDYERAQKSLKRFVDLSPEETHGVANDLIETLNTFN